MNYDKKCQLLIIGDSTVGKTSILTKYSSKTFNENYLATVGLDFFTKDEVIDNKIIRVKIWDTAGQERYKSLTRCFFQKAQGVMIVYDVNCEKSYNNLKFWIESLKSNLYEDFDKVPIILIGNKIDIPKRKIDKEIAKDFAKSNDCEYFETSAKTGEGVDNAIRELVKQVMGVGEGKFGKDNLKLNKNESTGRKCC